MLKKCHLIDCLKLVLLNGVKKIIKISYNLLSIGRDYLINELLLKFDIQYTVQIYQLITVNGSQVALTIMLSKLGLTKIAILLIIGFLL